MNIERARYSDLSADRRSWLEAIAEREFGHIDLVRETQWADPDWSFQAFDGGELVALYNLVERTIEIDGVPVRVAGLNNMITLPAHRGRGAASRLLRETQLGWFEWLGAECGLLLCADELVTFYERLQWKRVAAPVVYSQAGGLRTWAAQCMRLDPRAGKVVEPRRIDLCGLPW